MFFNQGGMDGFEGMSSEGMPGGFKFSSFGTGGKNNKGAGGMGGMGGMGGFEDIFKNLGGGNKKFNFKYS